MKSFGFSGLIKKLGIERRVIASGINKDRMDPFLPQNREDLAKLRQVIGEVHANFEEAVLTGRQGKIDTGQQNLFSGDFWAGRTAVKLGLVDGLGNLSDVMKKEFKVSRYKDYSQSGSVLRSLAGQVGTSLNETLSRVFE
jgi:ClpP class serine protease